MLTGGKVASTLQELWSGLLAVVLRRTGKTNNFLKHFIRFNVRCVDRLTILLSVRSSDMT